jgi:hypothetical protein
MRALKCIAFCLLLAGTAVSQDSVSAPSVAKRDKPIKINHPSGAKVQAIYARTESGVVVWSFLADEHFERADTYTVFAAPPGDYLITTGDSTILKIVEEGGPQPKPNPRPEPGPDPPKPEPEPEPKPAPKIKINWAVWIYEQTDAVDQLDQTNVRQSIETRQYLESQGIKLAAYDDDQDAAKAGPFREVADKLPALVLMQDASKFSVHEAPSSLHELKELIAEASNE